jgi:hypothetical protein
VSAHDVLQVLHAAFRGLPLAPRVLLEAMALTGGSIYSSTRVAAVLGCGNRFAIARLMHEAGLPTVRELAGWISVLCWLMEAERTQESLFTITTRAHRAPAACYRLVKRLTGATWRSVRSHGSAWVLRRLQRRCRELHVSTRQQNRSARPTRDQGRDGREGLPAA